MPVAVIGGAGQLKGTASVSETLVPKLSAGDTADVYVSSLDAHFTATISSVERAANMQTKLYAVTLTVPADAEGLLSGMFAEVTFHTDVSENTIVIPTEAILTEHDTQYVFVVEDDTARYVEITTGLTGSGVTEVTSGLKAGELVHVISDAHIYDRHVDIVKELIERPQYPAPKVTLNPEITNFYDFTVDDVIVENYQKNPQVKNIPVAI